MSRCRGVPVWSDRAPHGARGSHTAVRPLGHPLDALSKAAPPLPPCIAFLPAARGFLAFAPVRLQESGSRSCSVGFLLPFEPVPPPLQNR